MSNYKQQFKYKDIAIYFSIAIFFILDRLLKCFALQQPDSFYLIKPIFSFKFIPNYNIAFSLPIQGTFLNIIIFLIILSIIYIIFNNKSDKKEKIMLTILLVGAISNLGDRLIYGYVIDYLYIKYFTIFNLSDVMISLSVISLIIYSHGNGKLKSSKKTYS